MSDFLLLWSLCLVPFSVSTVTASQSGEKARLACIESAIIKPHTEGSVLGNLTNAGVTLAATFRKQTSYPYAHPFNGPLSGTTRVSRYQKGKTNLDFTEARDSELLWHQLGHMQVCISL